jgi:aminopeptidase N
VWAAYQFRLSFTAGTIARPDGCDTHDALALFNDAPYMKGAFFYRALAAKIGAGVLDRALRRFYLANRKGYASMDDLLISVLVESGYDPTACATAWLKSGPLPAMTACP